MDYTNDELHKLIDRGIVPNAPEGSSVLKELARAVIELRDGFIKASREAERLTEALEKQTWSRAGAGGYAIEMEIKTRNTLCADVDRLKTALRTCATHVGGGVSAECSVDFHCFVADEVGLSVARLRQDSAFLERRLAQAIRPETHAYAVRYAEVCKRAYVDATAHAERLAGLLREALPLLDDLEGNLPMDCPAQEELYRESIAFGEKIADALATGGTD